MYSFHQPPMSLSTSNRKHLKDQSPNKYKKLILLVPGWGWECTLYTMNLFAPESHLL